MKFFYPHLKFKDPDLENLFRDDYYIKSLSSIRIALILGAILYSIFGILDIYVAPYTKNYIWFIRFGVVVPLLACVLIVSFFKFFKKIMQFILSFASLVAGLGIVAMIAIAVEIESSLYYYAGLMLVLMWTYTFVKLRFVYAATTCWIIVLSYEIIAVFFQKLTTTPGMLKIFMNNNFFFISANVIGMFACYLIELYTRKDFLQRREISENREELKKERNELETRINIMNKELEMARLIQQKLIPESIPDSNIFSLYKPMEAVGGDLLDFFEFHPSKKIGIFLSDVSGHGVPAALITSMIKSSLVESARREMDPAKLLMHLNDLLRIQTEDNFVTAFYGIFNPEDRSIVFSNAGHHPPTVIFKNKIGTLDGSRSLPLAVLCNDDMKDTGNSYTNSKAILPKNSKLVLYTDGLVEARGIDKSSKDYGHIINRRFLEFKNLNCKGFVEALYDNLIEFRGGNSFDDDICLICMDVW